MINENYRRNKAEERTNESSKESRRRKITTRLISKDREMGQNDPSRWYIQAKQKKNREEDVMMKDDDI